MITSRDREEYSLFTADFMMGHGLFLQFASLALWLGAVLIVLKTGVREKIKSSRYI